MKAALAALLLGLAAQDADPPGEGTEPRPPGPRRAVAGLAGFQITSRVVFVGAPDRPHVLEVAYVFPDRARWSLRSERGSSRRVEYRFGERFFELAQGAREAVEYPREAAEDQLRQKELRRAVMTWPDGFAWTGEGARRSAPILPLAGDPPGSAIGTLRARLDGEGRPTRVEALRGDDTVQESLDVLAWRRVGERLWPARLRLESGGAAIWDETVEQIVARVNLLDSHFLPPGPRPPTGSSERILRVLLRGHTLRTHALAEGAGWGAALAREAVLREAAAKELEEAGLALDATPTFTVAPDGGPLEVVLRLSTPAEPPPKGWTTVHDREGLVLVVTGRSALEAAEGLGDHLRLLRRRLRPGEETATAAVRFYKGGTRTQVTLPLR